MKVLGNKYLEVQMKVFKTAVMVISISLISACAGIKEGIKKDNLEQVRTMAAFDLNCDKEKLDVQILSVMDHWADGGLPKEIGVKGCGRQARYTGVRGVGWVANTISD